VPDDVYLLRVEARVGFGAATFQTSKPGDHQTIGLACERGGQNRMTLGVAGELLRKRDELLAAERGTTTCLFGHLNNDRVIAGSLATSTVLAQQPSG
jgi:hypothetical protein